MRACAVERLAARLVGMLGLVGLVLGGCLIEERTFDEQYAKCNEYCSLVEAKCGNGNYKVYDRPDACMAVCALMDPGNSLGGSESNSLLCRMNKLNMTGFEPATDCPAVGAGGNGVCGSDCAALCKLRTQVCSELQPDNIDIKSPNTCLDSCPFLADSSTLDASRDRSGDTLQCRLIHVSEAAVSKELAVTHCEHSQITPTPGETVPCHDPANMPLEDDCATFCKLAMGICQGGDLQVYEDEPQCRRVCRALNQGAPGDMDVNTVRCRRYHAYNAMGDPAGHCTHVGPTGDGHCGQGNCPAYCQILKQACGGQFTTRFAPGAEAADLGSCELACADLDGAGNDEFHDSVPRYNVLQPPTGPSLLCRTFHAVKALQTPNDAAECAAALGDPGSACQ